MEGRALITFGLLFASLCIGVGFAVGLGSSAPNVPPHAVAIVEEAPPGTGTISKAEFEQALRQSAGFAGQARPARPGDENYEVVMREAMSSLLGAVWLRGQAEAMGIEVSDQEVGEKLDRSGEAPSLREAGFTRTTMYERILREMLVRRIEGALEAEADVPSRAEVEAYFREVPPSEAGWQKSESFAEAQAEATAALQQIKNQEVFSEFDAAFSETWWPRTHCATGFVVEECSEYPAFAPTGTAACYEADAEVPPEGCPAAVHSPLAAQPGSITPFKPSGENLVQRPYPEGGSEGEFLGG